MVRGELSGLLMINRYYGLFRLKERQQPSAFPLLQPVNLGLRALSALGDEQIRWRRKNSPSASLL